MKPSFKPSQVRMDGFPPLVATMGRTEREITAAFIVRACQVLGDEWRALGFTEIADVIAASAANGVEPWASLSRMPFQVCDTRDLVESGYARLVVDGDDERIEFTDRGFGALARRVRADREIAP